MSDVRATVLSGGHPFEAGAFADLLAGLAGVTCTHVPWPEAEGVFAPGGLEGTDVLVCYDMQGLGFNRGRRPDLIPPSSVVVEGWDRLLAAGVPVVALHHNLAAWPTWERYADIVGGRYHYVAASVRGQAWPDSGYRHGVSQQLRIVAPDHPVCAGLPATFELTDETYLCPVFEAELTSLIVSDAPKTDADFYGTDLALHGRMYEREGWSHPPGSTMAAWTHQVDRSTVVYVQPGDGPEAYANPYYRRLLANAITWASTTRP
jgi:uncharacterized protein